MTARLQLDVVSIRVVTADAVPGLPAVALRCDRFPVLDFGIGDQVTVLTDSWEYECCGDLLTIGDQGRFTVAAAEGLMHVHHGPGGTPIDGYATHHDVGDTPDVTCVGVVTGLWECFCSLRRDLADDSTWERVLASGQSYAVDRIERFPHRADEQEWNAKTRLRPTVFDAWLTQFRVLEILPTPGRSAR
ncbi:MAG: hypothetical protein M3Y49_00885 [Actinomycetota bacterium]|nr:hypothetical protein [Actinomycetota bacterium]